MATITLNLPEPTMKQAYQAAASLRRPVEDILADMLSTLLPTADNAPAIMQTELTRMTWMDDKALWELVDAGMSDHDERKLRQLSEMQGERQLSTHKQKELNALREQYGHITLRKARAYSLLSLRGGKPLLNQ